jgi:hypothetical protein
MHLFQSISPLLFAALVNAHPGLIHIRGLLQNLGLAQDDQPGQYIKADPSKGDVRSPCPAVNVLANHGYM